MPAGFWYQTDNSGSNAARYRHFVCYEGPQRRSRAGLIRVAGGFTGNKVVTGLGFAPEAVVFFGTQIVDGGFGNDGNVSPFAGGAIHVGAATATDQWGMGMFTYNLTQTDIRTRYSRHCDNKVVTSLLGSSVDIEASLVSLDADGFTVQVNDAPSGTKDIDVVYLALAGGGSYHCGTALSPAASGTQQIDLPFRPKAIFLASVSNTALNSTQNAHAWMTLGGADADEQYNVWCGSKTGDVYVNEVATSGKALSMFTDASDSQPFQPLPIAEAALTINSAGFSLDWTVTNGVINVDDGPQRYFSWFAVDGLAEIGRWVYQHPGGFINAFVQTSQEPVGLLFFQNHQGTEDRSQAATEGCAIGLGACDNAPFLVPPPPGLTVPNQWAAGYYDMSQAPFFNPVGERDLLARAFGSYSKQIGTAPNHMEDRGIVFDYVPLTILIDLSKTLYVPGEADPEEWPAGNPVPTPLPLAGTLDLSDVGYVPGEIV